jgi:hypothetical protein
MVLFLKKAFTVKCDLTKVHLSFFIHNLEKMCTQTDISMKAWHRESYQQDSYKTEFGVRVEKEFNFLIILIERYLGSSETWLWRIYNEFNYPLNSINNY